MAVVASADEVKAKLKALSEKHDADIKGILTADQYHKSAGG